MNYLLKNNNYEGYILRNLHIHAGIHAGRHACMHACLLACIFHTHHKKRNRDYSEVIIYMQDKKIQNPADFGKLLDPFQKDFTSK